MGFSRVSSFSRHICMHGSQSQISPPALLLQSTCVVIWPSIRYTLQCFRNLDVEISNFKNTSVLKYGMILMTKLRNAKNKVPKRSWKIIYLNSIINQHKNNPLNIGHWLLYQGNDGTKFLLLFLLLIFSTIAHIKRIS